MATTRAVEFFLDRLTERDLEGFLALFSEDAVMEMPFAPPGAPPRLSGSRQLRAFWTIIFDSMATMRFENVDIDTLGSGSRVISFHEGRVMLADGTPYDNRYVCLFEIDGSGKISRYVEHYNSLIVARSFGGEDQLASLFGPVVHSPELPGISAS